ncbi:mini-chromosome maintenance complex-binding protein [Diabrotica undecimpunctata]|uniref:mini-chromosome maintenance complex-binding protein n=1 Tax=Diabrotica undecimpunctata TaxID=50387 RepID=UPI003B636F77
MDIQTITPLQFSENEENFSELLKDATFRNEIPLLNVNKLEHLGNLKLVRFHGMIQDMHSPEYYLEKFEVVNENTKESCWFNGKYRECIRVKENKQINFHNDSNVTSERQTFVVISIPAKNSWVRSVEEKHTIQPTKYVAANMSSGKRIHEECMDAEEMLGPSTSKNSESKKICSETTQSVENKPVSSQKNDIFPLSDTLINDQNQVFHIKLYKDQDKLKINDVCEFVGFLDIDPSTNANMCNGDMETEESTCFIPKIHCVHFTKLKHNNPLVNSEIIHASKDNFNPVRKDLLLVLTQLLLGDSLTAEYLLLHLLSEVYLRRDGLALGKLSLNISNVPNLPNVHYPSELYKFIEKLVTKSLYFPMTLENLNDLTFIPKKDYDLNYLSSGVLQLSDNTHFILDEIKLTPGKLNESGLNNVKAISSAIKHQTVSYDFKFYPLEFHCDIPFLVLSEGKSMVYSDVHIALQPDEICINTFKEIVEAAEHFLKPDLLNEIRKYLTLARMTEYIITEQVENFIQNEFVKMRQNRSETTADDLHNMLILARLIAISEGKSGLDEASWKKASDMEEQRRNRIK